MKRSFPTKRAFTLIEMLIVIVIIGILATALIPRILSVQGRARDTRRKTDLRMIFQANEIYRGDNGSYAKAIGLGNVYAGCGSYNCAGSTMSLYAQPWIDGLSGYLGTAIPVDPLNNGGAIFLNSGYHTYYYANVSTAPAYKDAYDLLANLENNSDPDACKFKQWKYSIGKGSTRCAGTTYPNAYEFAPYSE